MPDSLSPIERAIKQTEASIRLVEAYPNNRRSYSDLYDAVQAGLPFVTKKREIRMRFGRGVTGILGNRYLLQTFSRFGISQASVSDLSNADVNPVIKRYSTGSSLGIKATYGCIWEVDTSNKTERRTHDRYFLR